jgi:DNA-binding GntR family transcriptional regulator
MPETSRPYHPRMRRRSVFTSRLVRTGDASEQPRVEADLRHAILTGDEPPGTPIPVDAVAAFFGVSHIPVREALKTLLGEGLVEHRPHVGYSVAKLTFAEFRELYDVRQALESSALRAAVLHATPHDDGLVEQIHEDLGVAIEQADERGYHLASRLFHTRLGAPSGMKRLISMYDSAWNMTEPARPMSRVPEHERSGFQADHARMLAAFVARDADALVAESDRHYAHLKAAIGGFADDPDRFRDPV